MISNELISFSQEHYIPPEEFACGERTILENTDLGQSLQLTAAGKERLRYDTDFAKLLMTTSEHIAAHTPKDAIVYLPSVVSIDERLKKSDTVDRVTVYAPAQPHDIVMRLGTYGLEAQIQFDTLSWLHDTLKNSPMDEQGFDFRAPEQYALLQSNNGLSAGFMERIYGTPFWVPSPCPTSDMVPERQATIAEGQRRTRHILDHLCSILKDTYLPLLNDLYQRGHVGNILVDQRWRYNIIDQPHLVRRQDLLSAYDRDPALLAFKALVGPNKYQGYLDTFMGEEPVVSNGRIAGA